MTDGQLIVTVRESLGWSRRKLASKLGLPIRWIVAAENDTDPVPRREQRRFRRKFVETLGEEIWVREDLPVRNTEYDLTQNQKRILAFLSVEKKI